MQHPEQFEHDQKLVAIRKKIKTLQKIEDANLEMLSITCVYPFGATHACEIMTILKAREIPVEFKVFIHNYLQQLIKEHNELTTI